MVILYEVKQILHTLVVIDLEDPQLGGIVAVLREDNEHLSVVRELYLSLLDAMQDYPHLLLQLTPLSLEPPEQDLIMELPAHFGLLHLHHINCSVHKVVDYVLLLGRIRILRWEYVLYQLNRVLLMLFVDLRVYNIKRWHLDLGHVVFQVGKLVLHRRLGCQNVLIVLVRIHVESDGLVKLACLSVAQAFLYRK